MLDFVFVFNVILIVSAAVFLIYAGKHGWFSSKKPSQITMREGEVSLLATEIVWFRKKVYLHKNMIPHGILDITNQRVVYTRSRGEKGEFSLEKAEIKGIVHAGGMLVNIQAKDGTVYSFNTHPAKDTLDALEKMGVPVQK